MRRALDAVKASDSDFDYEIEMPPPAEYKVLRTVMEPMDMPHGQGDCPRGGSGVQGGDGG